MFDIVGEIFFAIILLPVMMIFGTPFILILAFRSEKKYWDAVGDGYRAVWNWWKKHPTGDVWLPTPAKKDDQKSDQNK